MSCSARCSTTFSIRSTPELSVLNVTRYITFRTAAASLSALAISLLLGPWMVRKLREFQIGQVIRQEGPTTHRAKGRHADDGRAADSRRRRSVPTLLWAELTNVVRLDCGADDAGVRRHRVSRRLSEDRPPRSSRPAAALQDGLADRSSALVVGVVLLVLAQQGAYNTRLIFPFFKRLIPDLGWWLPAVRGLRAGRLVERRESDRRSRRSGDQHVRDRRGRVHGSGVRDRPPRARGVPAARPLSAVGAS